MKEQKVYVAIVTYNRKEYLLNLLEALQQSEKKISGILFLDNKSTDGTNQTLMEIGFTEKDDIGVLHENTWKSMKTYYFRNTENAGGAGGFANWSDSPIPDIHRRPSPTDNPRKATADMRMKW